ncbi:MAG TPA: N-acetylmuramoyl-L-alanine amidase [Candidatus Limnocylindria bacterium]|jgi:N-acetylmuramoyl-L-alanine amidase|nr:N-acetylmuramoyl-L-alanine amidase [Candidatus Limnocylindria bacterium]
MRRLFVIAAAGLTAVAATAVACGVLSPGSVPGIPGARLGAVAVPAGAPLPMIQDIDPEDLDPARDIPGVPPVALAPPGGAIVQSNGIRIPKPALPTGPRRIGIQVGHWMTDQVPAELGTRITFQTGTSWAGVQEVDVNMDIAQRIKAQLTARGYVVDLIPTTVPVGYIADVFLALHADGDGTGEKSGFKIAHGSRRGPYEDKLVSLLRDEYGRATGLDWDALGLSRNMSNYYSFNWGRYQHAAAPHTPAAILEMGFLSNDYDRELLVDKADGVATAIVTGIQRFLDDVPRSKIFGEDLIVPAGRGFPSPSPRP